MALELRQSLKLTQQLVMTPQLQQAIKLLQLSRLELLENIHQELETNPLLEEASGEVYEDGEPSAEDSGEPAGEATFQEVEIIEKTREDFDWESYLDEYSASTPVLAERDPSQETPAYDLHLTRKASLYDHLAWQLRLSAMDLREREIGDLILGNLNKDGYLDATLEEIAQMGGASIEEVEKVLAKIQRFDPLGIAARDPRECLLIQAQSLELQDDLVVRIIRDHLQYLENKNYQGLVRVLKRSPEEIQDAINVILNLDPRPGRIFSEEDVQYISPDIYVYKVDDDFVISLNEDGMPKLRVSSYYKEALANGSELTAGAKEYIHTKLRSAAWLIKSIHQRQRTIYKVTQSIINIQRDFFERGVAYLRPMVLRDIAEDVGMHESTISRVTTNKYVHTPQGIFELKYFFNNSISSFIGEPVASESVKERIKQIIGAENPANPYSDNEIVAMLKKENIDIARRTVAKYREMLRILSSNKRRQAPWGNPAKGKR
jgi:RNA polymerase sigma-54 factor